MEFEFDPGKNEINKAKHGLSLENAKALWSVAGVEVSLGKVKGEFRYARLAFLRGAVHIAIFTHFAGRPIRLISARAATADETAVYEQNRKK